MIELDHVSQSYTLNNNELGRSRGFQTEIEEIIRRQKRLGTSNERTYRSLL